MKKSIFKYIFGILLSSALVVTGCGSSSSNNPVSSGSVNSGLINVRGNVTNSTENVTVSFYTPSAVYIDAAEAKNYLRTSVANNGVYTFNADEKGNYEGQIPAGDYYVIAQNADGSMKYASSRQSFAPSARADVDITLVPTKTIEGILTTTTNLVQGQYVYLENMPFVSVTGSDGKFVFKNVPVNDDTNYTICSNIWVGNTRYKFFAKDINKEIMISEKKSVITIYSKSIL